MVIKGNNAGNIKFGNSFTTDGLPDERFDYMLSNPPFGVEWKKVEELDALCNLFTELCQRIDISGLSGSAPQPLTGDDEVNFLFGGWSWRKQKFGLWHIGYNAAIKAFAANALHEREDKLPFYFIGDATKEAEGLMKQILVEENLVFSRVLNMEPIRVLARMIEDKSYTSIGGSMQIAKVYQSGLHEFFGVRMPSGRLSVLGRDVNPYDAPPLRFIDFQNGELIDNLPEEFRDLQNYEFGIDTKFVSDCYPGGKLKAPLLEAHRKRLQRILRDVAYRDFLKYREEATATAQAERLEVNAEFIVSTEGAANE